MTPRRTQPVTRSFALGADVAVALDEDTEHYGTVVRRSPQGHIRVSGLPNRWFAADVLRPAPRPEAP